MVAVLMAAVLTGAAPAEAGPATAAVMVAMLLDLPLGQQARGLPPAGASLVLLVLPIKLSNQPVNRCVNPEVQKRNPTNIRLSFVRPEHVQVAPEKEGMERVIALSFWQLGRDEY